MPTEIKTDWYPMFVNPVREGLYDGKIKTHPSSQTEEPRIVQVEWARKFGHAEPHWWMRASWDGHRTWKWMDESMIAWRGRLLPERRTIQVERTAPVRRRIGEVM